MQDNSNTILPLLLKIEKADKMNYHNKLEITVLLSYILLQINDCFRQSAYNEALQPNTDTLSSIISYINENITSDLSVEKTAASFFISKSYLNRTFKNRMGFTVWDYIVSKRLFMAKEYIFNGLSTAKAAELSGFNDYSTFYRQFVKHFSCAPSEIKVLQNH